MRKITMYNVWFGDCFVISGKSGDLIVDFGLSGDGKADRKEVYPRIIQDFKPFGEKDLLVTHFHEDHIAGLLYFMQSGLYSGLFCDTLYIPDIFSDFDDPAILPLCILEELLSGCYINKKREVNLCEFCKFLCGNVQKVIFLRRGKEFKEEYIALWPDVDYLQSTYKKYIVESGLNNAPFYNELVRISREIAKIVNDRTKIPDIGSFQPAIAELDMLEEQLRKLQEEYHFEQAENKEIYLNGYGNGISIVFHNKISDEENILFTGDVPESYMKRIAGNQGKAPVPMHEDYCYIKIPHHGTPAYFYDFRAYNPKVIMIPNGKRGGKGYKVTGKYIADEKTKMYCSNCNWCEGWNIRRKCSCPNREIIYRDDLADFPGRRLVAVDF